MIPRANIDAWRAKAPWRSDAMVEQDLIFTADLDNLLPVGLSFDFNQAFDLMEKDVLPLL